MKWLLLAINYKECLMAIITVLTDRTYIQTDQTAKNCIFYNQSEVINDNYQ